MSQTNRRVVLAERPTAMVDEATTRIETTEVTDLADGEALVAVRYLSIDPTIRTWMNDAPGYLPPIELGDVIRSGGIGEVVESKCSHIRSATRSSAWSAGRSTRSPTKVSAPCR